MDNDTTSSELLGHFIYDDTLTYDELLQIEEQLIKDFEYILTAAGAVHIDFTPLGDAIMFQCQCIGHKIYIFRKLACEFSKIIPDKVKGRIFCISHSLHSCHLYWIRPNKWHEQGVSIPQKAPDGLKYWQRNEGKQISSQKEK